jgi:hypothetical protein
VSSKGGGQQDVITVQQGDVGEIHPKGLLDAISYIDQSYANERGGCIIDPRFLTTKQRIEFMEVGLRSAFASGMVSAVMTPLAIGVIEKYIPIFGSVDPSLSDQFCALLLALAFSFGYSIFLGVTATHFVGAYTRTMIINLLGGMAAGALFKGIIAFVGFHVIYFKLLTENNIVWALSKLYYLKARPETVYAMYYWFMEFKNVFITSAYFVLVTTLIFIIIPFLSMTWAYFRNRKLIATGVVNVYQERI